MHALDSQPAQRLRWIPAAVCALLLLMPPVLEAQALLGPLSKSSSPPRIDGMLTAGEWDTATRIDDLHQVTPVEFAEPSQRTIFLVLFDEDFLYVAAHCFDTHPDRIVAQTLRQGGSLSSDDSVFVILDPFDNRRSGYKFEMNANGVRVDSIYTSGTRATDDWDGIWRGAAKIVADGWTVEMAIPFKTLSFPQGGRVWGFNVGRSIARSTEEIAWRSHNGQTNPTTSGELAGFSGLSQGKGLDVIPSASSTSVRNHVANTSDSDFRPSLDINYKVTPAVNLVVTLNTDFAATEVDRRQLDVSRFSLFFPEKRTFFLTDFDIFEFGGITQGRGRGGGSSSVPGASSGNNGLPFFSRRIGLSASREPVDLTGGLKLSGRIGRVDFGTLYVRQDEYQDVRASDLFVARFATGVLKESIAGAILTHGDPTSNDTSSTVGLDFSYRNTRIGKNRSLEGRFWVQRTDNDGVDGQDLAWSAAFGMPARKGFEWGGQVHEAQANYDPRLGFANRTGVRMYSGRTAYTWINEGSRWAQRYETSLTYDRWDYLDTGRLQTKRIGLTPFNVRNSSGDSLRMTLSANEERLLDGENPLRRLGIALQPGDYSYDRADIVLRTASFRRVSGELRVSSGDYYNGELDSVSVEFSWRAGDHVGFEIDYDYDAYAFPGTRATTRQITLNNDIAFNAYWSLLTLAQYDNLSDDIGINMRLRYNRAAGQDFWLVLNHNLREYEPGDPEYRGGGFRSVETVAAVKLRYTFRF